MNPRRVFWTVVVAAVIVLVPVLLGLAVRLFILVSGV
jgi:hypothetical protein